MDLEKDNPSFIRGFENHGRAIPGHSRSQFIAASFILRKTMEEADGTRGVSRASPLIG